MPQTARQRTSSAPAGYSIVDRVALATRSRIGRAVLPGRAPRHCLPSQRRPSTSRYTMNIEIVPNVEGLAIGMGVDILTGEAKAPVVTNPPIASFPGTDGSGGLVPSQFTWTTSSLVNSTSKYTEVIDAAASASGSAWTEDGKVSVSSSVDFLRAQKLADSPRSFLISRSLMTSYSAPTAAQLASITLPDAAKKLAPSDPAAFIDQYGTHVVLGATYGAYFYGSLNILTVTERDKTAVSSSLSTEISDFELANGKFTADFAATVKTMNRYYDAQPTSVLYGVDQGSYPLNTVDQMQDFLDNHFSAQLENHGAGQILSLLCFAWDLLPDVHTIPGYKSGMLALNIAPTVTSL